MGTPIDIGDLAQRLANVENAVRVLVKAADAPPPDSARVEMLARLLSEGMGVLVDVANHANLDGQAHDAQRVQDEVSDWINDFLLKAPADNTREATLREVVADLKQIAATDPGPCAPQYDKGFAAGYDVAIEAAWTRVEEMLPLTAPAPQPPEPSRDVYRALLRTAGKLAAIADVDDAEAQGLIQEAQKIVDGFRLDPPQPEGIKGCIHQAFRAGYDELHPGRQPPEPVKVAGSFGTAVAAVQLADAAHEVVYLSHLGDLTNVEGAKALGGLEVALGVFRYEGAKEFNDPPKPHPPEPEPVESDPEFLARMGTNSAEWAAEFRKTALRLGYSDMDEGWLIGWFANAMVAAQDEVCRTSEKPPADGLAEQRDQIRRKDEALTNLVSVATNRRVLIEELLDILREIRAQSDEGRNRKWHAHLDTIHSIAENALTAYDERAKEDGDGR